MAALIFLLADGLSSHANGGTFFMWCAWQWLSCCRVQALGLRTVAPAPGVWAQWFLAQRLSCSEAHGILQGLNPHALHW